MFSNSSGELARGGMVRCLGGSHDATHPTIKLSSHHSKPATRRSS